MDFYIVLSLATVLGLISWWSFLAITALRDESSIQQDKSVSSRRFSRLANYLISMVHSWR